MTIFDKSQRQTLMDLDQDGEWDSWEIQRADSRLEFDFKVAGIFMTATFSKMEKGRVRTVHFRYSPVTRSYVIAQAASRRPATHHLDFATMFEDPSDGESAPKDCGLSGHQNSASNLAFEAKKKMTQLQSGIIQSAGMVDDSCLRFDQDGHRFHYVVSSLAKMMTENDPGTNRYLACMAQAGWSTEAVRIRGYLAQQSANPTASKYKCESMEGKKPAGEYREASGEIILRNLQNEKATAELIRHETLHDAARLAEGDIQQVNACCGSRQQLDPGICDNAKAESKSRYLESLRGLMAGFSDYPEIQDLILQRFLEEGSDSLIWIKDVYKEAMQETIHNINERACNPKYGVPPASCAKTLAKQTGAFVDLFTEGLCKGSLEKACETRKVALGDFRKRAVGSCRADIKACFTRDKIDQARIFSVVAVGGKPPQELIPTPAIQTPEGEKPVRVAEPAVGPKVDLDDPAPARAAIAQTERQAFETYRKAEGVYAYVAKATDGFTRSLALGNGFDPTSPGSGRPRALDPQPGQPPKVSADLPNDPPSDRLPAYIPAPTRAVASEHATARAAPKAGDEPTTLMGIPVADPTALISRVANKAVNNTADSATGAAIAASGPLPLPTTGGGKRRLAPNPARTDRSTASAHPPLDYKERLKEPYPAVQSLLEDPRQRRSLFEYLDAHRIQIRPPTGAPFGHRRPLTRITYPSATADPEVSRVGR